MKRLISLLLAGLFLLMAGMAFAARGDYTGVWAFAGVEYQGMYVDAESLGMDMTITLNPDGSCILESSDVDSAVGVWSEVSGGIDVDGMLFALRGGQLVADAVDGMKMYFIRNSAPVSTPGDVDRDGDVDMSDAADLLRYGAGENVTIDTAAADVNDDGREDIFDALLLFQHEAGWDVTLK